jgi:hypothetical protein
MDGPPVTDEGAPGATSRAQRSVSANGSRAVRAIRLGPDAGTTTRKPAVWSGVFGCLSHLHEVVRPATLPQGTGTRLRRMDHVVTRHSSADGWDYAALSGFSPIPRATMRSTLAAITKSFVESPPMAWVVQRTWSRPQPTSRSG